MYSNAAALFCKFLVIYRIIKNTPGYSGGIFFTTFGLVGKLKIGSYMYIKHQHNFHSGYLFKHVTYCAAGYAVY